MPIIFKNKNSDFVTITSYLVTLKLSQLETYFVAKEIIVGVETAYFINGRTKQNVKNGYCDISLLFTKNKNKIKISEWK